MKPILLDFPNEFCTDRLSIRMPKPGDGDVVHSAIEESLPQLRPWLPFAHLNQTVEDVEANIREAHAKFLRREDLRFHIFHRDSGEFIASSGLHRINWKVPKFEIGYWINTKHSGKGFMSEAVQKITKFAFNELKGKRVEIRCDSLNSKSRALAERVGFKLDGIFKNDDVSQEGQLRDTCIYSKIKL